MDVSTLASLAKTKKESNSGTVKLVIFGIILVLGVVASIRWHLKWRNLQKTKAELDIEKRRLVEARYVFKNTTKTKEAEKAYEIIMDRVEERNKDQLRRVKKEEALLKETKERIKRATTWADLEGA